MAILYFPLAFPPIVSDFSDSNSVSIYIVIHFDFDDLMRLRMLQLMVLISCVFSVCHLIIIFHKNWWIYINMKKGVAKSHKKHKEYSKLHSSSSDRASFSLLFFFHLSFVQFLLLLLILAT
jgi:cell division protein FtsL